MAQSPTGVYSLGRGEIMTLLLSTPYFTMLDLCQSNKAINAVCQEELLWTLKFQSDFSSLDKDPRKTSRQQYKEVAEGLYQGLFRFPSEFELLPMKDRVEFIRNQLPLPFKYNQGSDTYSLIPEVTLNKEYRVPYTYTYAIRGAASIVIDESEAFRVQRELVNSGYHLVAPMNLLRWEFNWLQKQDLAIVAE